MSVPRHTSIGSTDPAAAIAVAALAPHGVVGWLDELPLLDAPLHAAEQPGVERMAPVRRREYVAGRTAARRALRALTGREWSLPRRSDHAPSWPEGLCGSLSHSRRYAIAVAGHRRQITALGVDVEGDVRVEPDLWPELFTATEQTRLAAVGGHEQVRLASLMFSAKEAGFKCLAFANAFPSGGFAPRQIEIQLDFRSQTFCCAVDSATHAPAGRFTQVADHWVTLCWLPADPRQPARPPAAEPSADFPPSNAGHPTGHAAGSSNETKPTNTII